MELLEVLKDLVSDLGFPICCVAVMFKQMQDERKSESDQREKDREAHEREARTWAEAFDRNTSVIDHNTMVLSKLADHLK